MPPALPTGYALEWAGIDRPRPCMIMRTQLALPTSVNRGLLWRHEMYLGPGKDDMGIADPWSHL
jgi:hypothetical protein